MRKLYGLVLTAGGLFGCEMGPSVPVDAPPRNVWFVDDPRRLESAEPVAVVRVHCISCQEYGRRMHGTQIKVWYIVQCQLIQVESGKWGSDKLTFLTTDTVLTPESGIILEGDRWPYIPGKELRVWLNTRENVAQVIGHQFVVGGK